MFALAFCPEVAEATQRQLLEVRWRYHTLDLAKVPERAVKYIEAMSGCPAQRRLAPFVAFDLSALFDSRSFVSKQEQDVYES